jgi:Cupredoxin-like domain
MLRVLACTLLFVVTHAPRCGAQTAETAGTIEIHLTEWTVDASTARLSAGPVSIHVSNVGKMPHVFEIEGQSLERRTRVLQPGQSETVSLSLTAGEYTLYCPVGNGSHKHLGMLSRLTVVRQNANTSVRTNASARSHMQTPAIRGIEVVGGGTVLQILPGPFPFADSAAAVIAVRPVEQQLDLQHKAERGPYSNAVAVIGGTATFTAWDRGASGDSVAGSARFTTQDGARWALAIDRVQTSDIPFNPRFGGVIMGLYYHGASGAHTPLVPTIQSDVALWAYGHLTRNDVPVTDSALVHVMLLSRTRRAPNFALSCWDCTRNPIDELQLQITPAPGHPPFDVPGGVLFVNWQQSRARKR